MNTQPEGKKSMAVSLEACHHGLFTSTSIHPDAGQSVTFQAWTHGGNGARRVFKVRVTQPEENGPVVVFTEIWNGEGNDLLTVSRQEF